MRSKSFTGLMLIVFLASILTTSFTVQPIEANTPEPELVAASKMPELESFFRYEEPWLGADAAYSLDISEFHPNTILWTFGDTLWGRIENDTKIWNMTNNSVALHNLENETIDFYHEEQINVFEIAEWVEGGWLWGPWALAPFIQNGKIYWFLMVIDFAGWTNPIGHWLADIYLAEVDNPEDNPGDWNINYYPIDFLPAEYENYSFLWLATDVYVENDTIYMYGVRQEQVYDGANQEIFRHYVVARTQENITNFDAWEFYDGENWTSTPQIVQGGPSDLSTEYSVDYLPPFDKYLLIYQRDQAEDRLSRYSVWGRWADTPIGPWSEPQLLYTPPELYLNESYYAYAMKGHYPYLSETDREVVVSYVLRSSLDDALLLDPLLYCPYFANLTFQLPPSDLTAVFTCSPNSSYVNMTVAFDGSASTPYCNGTHLFPISSYSWDLGDGKNTTASEYMLNYVYREVGVYNVTLTVIDSRGFNDTNSVQLTVKFPGDANGDGFIGGYDATIVGINWWQSVPPASHEADFNGDGFVGGYDATIIGIRWWTSVPKP